MPNDVEKNLTSINPDNQYLVVNNLYGKITEDPLNIKVIEDNYKGSNSTKVLLDNQVEAFIELGEPSNAFDYKVVASEIADLFDIKVTPIHRLKSNDKQVGIIRRSNAELDQIAITFGQIAKSLYLKIQAGAIEGKPWLDTINRIAATQGPIVDEADFKMILDMPLYLAIRSFTGEITPLRYLKIRKDYTNALLFDFIINQAKRSLDSYTVVVKAAKDPKEPKEPNFGALYSFNSQSSEGLNPDEYVLNTNIVKREDLIKYLFKYYYTDIAEFSKMISDFLPDYQKCLELILKNNYPQGEYQQLLNTILSNLELIKQYELQYNDKTQTNIELTQTNISLQLKAKRDINKVLAKYPEPKVDPVQKEIAEPVVEEGLKLILEPEKKVANQRSGFVNGTLVVLMILVIFGIGIGIGYVIFNISGV